MARRLTRLYVINVSSKADKDELEDLFNSCGKVTQFDIHKGEGFVEYRSSRDAAEAIKRLHNHKFFGKRLSVEYAVFSTNKFMKKKQEERDKDKAAGRCFKCGEKGHVAKNCPEKKKESKSRSRSNSSFRSKNKKRRSPEKSKSHRGKSGSRSTSKNKYESGDRKKEINESKDERAKMRSREKAEENKE